MRSELQRDVGQQHIRGQIHVISASTGQLLTQGANRAAARVLAENVHPSPVGRAHDEREIPGMTTATAYRRLMHAMPGSVILCIIGVLLALKTSYVPTGSSAISNSPGSLVQELLHSQPSSSSTPPHQVTHRGLILCTLPGTADSAGVASRSVMLVLSAAQAPAHR
ncbi:hypothetical protein BKA62DRAFT_150405 [Auriculariales sp. MPI-PUGE-AT-0066]|nr:hypothetical protein BKA62DRAFT_150405 [Auriculariales sp. MPI-PUGE-AT-0066]